MRALVVGGTSGLGREMANVLNENDEVIITGRHDPGVVFAEYLEFDLAGRNLPQRIGAFIADLPQIDTLVYAAGYYQEGRITDLEDEEIDEMLDVGERGLIFFVKNLLEKQLSLSELITITSTSQWVPRQDEPVYNAAKAGAAHFSNAIAEDGRVRSVLVAAPAGMKTPFWEYAGRDDLDSMMDPVWVANHIEHLRWSEFEDLPLHNTNKPELIEDYRYCFAKILRATGELPDRVEIVETR